MMDEFYIEWRGGKKQIYKTWTECKEQISKNAGAINKVGIILKQENNNNFYKILLKTLFKENYIPKTDNLKLFLEFKEPAIAVDASARGNPGIMEFRGVNLLTKEEIFRRGPFYYATNNIGEFLAIVLALAFLKKENKNWAIYSDSNTAITWVKKKKCKTKLELTERNKVVFDRIKKAEKWLQENEYKNPIIKWDTKNWGEIPADYGRK